MEEFIPTTFRMDVREEREAFFAQQDGKKSKRLTYIHLTTQHWFNWICVCSEGSGVKMRSIKPDLSSNNEKKQNSLCSAALRQLLPW